MSIAFKFRSKLTDGYLIPALVGTVATPLTSADSQKSVKYSTGDNVLLCADGDEIASFLASVETTLAADGSKLGNIIDVTVGTRHKAVIAAGSTTVVAGTSLVVSAAQSAIGTADAYPKVKAGTPTTYKWIVRSILSGAGAAGSIVLLERV